MKKTLFRSGLAVAVAWWGARQLSSIAKDVGRYNAMRTMSGDGPLSAGDVREALLPTHTSTKPTNAPHYGEDAKAPGFVQFLTSIPADIGRYLKISSM
jgi:hypothetical protein